MPQTLSQTKPPVAQASTPAPIRYQIHDLPRSQVHTVLIPADSGFAVMPALSPQTASLETFLPQQSAIAAINGGFFDPQNQQTTSYVIQQGRLVGDPTQNQRLMGNPDLAPYLDQILDRSEFRRYQCRSANQVSQIQYAIARHRDAVPPDCQLLEALGAGPQLLPDLTLEPEGFTTTDTSGNLIRDALGSRQPNARSAVGITAAGDILLVMAAQKPEMTPSGLSLSELADFLKDQGAKTALNLDGGSSSTLFYQQQTVYGKLNADGKPVQRPVKSVLLVKPLSERPSSARDSRL
ncbi:MAG: phosphodiester glycosidase family protein [Pegethrix bostrychoides GSE-TBD4-15B]|uniref:Phosphodiester glycosidase family protein n=1 Tax=Pegethrix bostrychoides GSE-TBD4-15B TaxID=2839662 RepID=A0A951P7V4_9CYAN|nr:phosphodiester glycosidase family protein [Pegethrix bostrychoides GSE-TBD4-15B]